MDRRKKKKSSYLNKIDAEKLKFSKEYFAAYFFLLEKCYKISQIYWIFKSL